MLTDGQAPLRRPAPGVRGRRRPARAHARRARRRHQPAQRAVPVVREPRLAAPGRRASRAVRAAEPDATASSRRSTTWSSTGPGDIVAAIDAMRRYPGVYQRVRVRGRRKAEGFRASHVYPRLMRDLLNDIATFGTERCYSASAIRGAVRLNRRKPATTTAPRSRAGSAAAPGRRSPRRPTGGWARSARGAPAAGSPRTGCTSAASRASGPARSRRRSDRRSDRRAPRAPIPPACASAAESSAPQVRDDLSLYQLARLIEVIADLHVRVDAERVVDGRQQIVRMHRLLLRRRGRRVRLAVLHAARAMPQPATTAL